MRLGKHPVDDLMAGLIDEGVIIDAWSSAPTWDGKPIDLAWAIEALWKPPEGSGAG